jgi:hypothetical protein
VKVDQSQSTGEFGLGKPAIHASPEMEYVDLEESKSEPNQLNQ